MLMNMKTIVVGKLYVSFMSYSVSSIDSIIDLVCNVTWVTKAKRPPTNHVAGSFAAG